MNEHSMHEASIPNPVLTPFSILIGEWSTTGSHPANPDTILHGHTSFEWLENGAFLVTRSEIDEPGVPSAIAIFGSDDTLEGFFMLYFDERGVSRKYEVTLNNNVWKMWRTAPGFSQRFTGTLAEDGNSILGEWEISRDDSSWEKDLKLTYRRIE